MVLVTRELTCFLYRYSAEDAISASFVLTLFQTILLDLEVTLNIKKHLRRSSQRHKCTLFVALVGNLGAVLYSERILIASDNPSIR